MQTTGQTIGVADTMFARYDMGALAIKTLQHYSDHAIERYTVPGFKDLPVACKKLIEEHDCDIVIALGMAGSADVDKTCAHEASQGLIQCELMTNTHIIEVFVYEDEAKNADELVSIFGDRVIKHAKNTIALLDGKDALTPRAGTGARQGHDDAGPVAADKKGACCGDDAACGCKTAEAPKPKTEKKDGCCGGGCCE